MAGPEIITLGCRLNGFESEIMRQNAVAAGGAADMVIINTCAVTAEAMRQAGQEIRRARRKYPGSRLVVTGCAAQIEPERFAKMPEVDAVWGNREKLAPARFDSADFGPAKLTSGTATVKVSEIMNVPATTPDLVNGYEGRTRAFVQVQNGCDHRCTFCIIPFGRGNAQSFHAQRIIEQTQRLVTNGYREITLTGVDIASYGKDLKARPTLGALCRKILDAVPDLQRLRLSSLDPACFDETLIDIIATQPRLMPHLHLSVQAGDDMILKRMKRRHLRADVIRLCRELKKARPEITFGADLIAGFPTETDAMFDNTRRLVDEAGLSFLHVFPYSPRPGTPAARMPQVPVPLRKERARLLRSLGERRKYAFYASLVGTEVAVLIEGNLGTSATSQGRTAHNAPVKVSGLWAAGEIVPVAVTDVSTAGLRGFVKT